MKSLHNKLHLSELLSYDCGPVGAVYDPAKTYCIRPTINLNGMGRGGFYRFNLANRPEGMGFHPGYFFCEWFDGPIRFTEYVNDVPVRTMRSPDNQRHVFTEITNHIPLPSFLLNRSRYMIVEAIGSNIIEVSFRHAGDWATQSIIDDYKTVDPSYDPSDIVFGIPEYQRVAADSFRERGNMWEEIPGTRS